MTKKVHMVFLIIMSKNKIKDICYQIFAAFSEVGTGESILEIYEICEII